MLSALGGENWLFRPFVFKMFSALDRLSEDGQEVADQFLPAGDA